MSSYLTFIDVQALQLDKKSPNVLIAFHSDAINVLKFIQDHLFPKDAPEVATINRQLSLWYACLSKSHMRKDEHDKAIATMEAALVCVTNCAALQHSEEGQKIEVFLRGRLQKMLTGNSLSPVQQFVLPPPAKTTPFEPRNTEVKNDVAMTITGLLKILEKKDERDINFDSLQEQLRKSKEKQNLKLEVLTKLQQPQGAGVTIADPACLKLFICLILFDKIDGKKKKLDICNPIYKCLHRFQIVFNAEQQHVTLTRPDTKQEKSITITAFENLINSLVEKHSINPTRSNIVNKLEKGLVILLDELEIADAKQESTDSTKNEAPATPEPSPQETPKELEESAIRKAEFRAKIDKFDYAVPLYDKELARFKDTLTKIRAEAHLLGQDAEFSSHLEELEDTIRLFESEFAKAKTKATALEANKNKTENPHCEISFFQFFIEDYAIFQEMKQNLTLQLAAIEKKLVLTTQILTNAARISLQNKAHQLSSLLKSRIEITKNRDILFKETKELFQEIADLSLTESESKVLNAEAEIDTLKQYHGDFDKTAEKLTGQLDEFTVAYPSVTNIDSSKTTKSNGSI